MHKAIMAAATSHALQPSISTLTVDLACCFLPLMQVSSCESCQYLRGNDVVFGVLDDRDFLSNRVKHVTREGAEHEG
jgi:hypothetical protein